MADVSSILAASELTDAAQSESARQDLRVRVEEEDGELGRVRAIPSKGVDRLGDPWIVSSLSRVGSLEKQIADTEDGGSALQSHPFT